MTGSFTPSGAEAVRFMLSTTPALVTMPVGLCILIGGRLGFVGQGISVGFAAGVILSMGAGYVRRGAVSLRSARARERLLAALTTVYWMTPVLALVALILGIWSIGDCFGRACTTDAQVFAVVGLVFAALACVASVALVALLRSPLWARQRTASVAGP